MKVPAALAGRGVTEHEWKTTCERLEEAARANFFYDYPICECIYWCVPLGPVQCCLCHCNPISWCVCLLPVEKANTRAKTEINGILGKYGIMAKVEEPMMEGRIATFTSPFDGPMNPS